MIGHAHLDPVWLWRQADGIDTALATARGACDRLDEYPQFIFTCSTRWFHDQARALDPALFERIRAFVRAGRWQAVGGMVIQPDCNVPMAESFARQLAEGQAFYAREFGRPTTVGYNVDSFGHTAYLPRFLREAGIDCYVFMRPAPPEKALPANLFRWRSPDGHEVTTFRLIGPYNASDADLTRHIETTLAAMPAGVDHTMCFYGVGDHGGGPTKTQIEWIRDHADAVAGAQFIFSHPRAFFDAVAPHKGALPVVEDELQHHAIGCYAVERRIKVAMRRAEARLCQAERAMEALPHATRPDDREAVRKAWQPVLFNQFHDMLGGTCIPESNAAVAGELGGAESDAANAIARISRRATRGEARPGEHRIALFNPSPEPFDGLVAHEPYGAPKPCAILDENGRAIPCQEIEPRAQYAWTHQLLFRTTIPAGGLRLLKLVPEDRAPQPAATSEAKSRTAAGAANPFSALRFAAARDGLRLGDWTLALEVHDDPTDTWSHSCVDRFAEALLGRFEFAGEWQAVETGPIRWVRRALGHFGHSRAWLRAIAVAGEPTLRIELAVVWAEVQRRLRLRVAAPAKLERRIDLVSGGPLVRPLDGAEFPLGGGMVLGTSRGAPAQHTLAVVAPEVFSVSADSGGASLTLLRSPYAAHHDPYTVQARPDYYVTDQGWHDFDLVLWPGCAMDPAGPAHLARQMFMPPLAWDLTG